MSADQERNAPGASHVCAASLATSGVETSGAFKLDTSGVALLPLKHMGDGSAYRHMVWSDLTPFAQGYTEAAILAIQWPDPAEGYGPSSSVIKFEWLAPEALALILRDCEAAADGWLNDSVKSGALFWSDRQSRPVAGFPRLTVFLSDQGLVCLREAGS